MTQNGLSRRGFLKGIGAGGAALMLANAGLPFRAAAERAAFGALRAGSLQTPPDVELLNGDVLGFSLTSRAWEGAFGWVTFRLHQAWHNGENVYYIRTDTSDATFAGENRLVHVPLLNAALSAEGATSQLYTFENGAADQYPVVSHVPNEDAYSPAWHVHRVSFNGTPTVLNSAEAIREAEAAGDVTIEALPLVVNFPVVKWAGGELAEDTEKVTYLGTGPLVSPVASDNMEVTFKLHQCYPGSRYIVTDTSAVPMAPMMSIAASAPTQTLLNVGATDEIWVWGNGIPGSGVMGFQPAIFDNAAGNPIWSPFWAHYTAVWADESQARLVTTSAEIRELQSAGAVQVFNGVPDMDQAMPPFVVNCPVPIKARNTFQAPA
ncbi:MAG: twin-arginine translocation signal domain-containing protein [Anaerolineae bacterium]|nr:twin-arginine translocation signal domain-containing protein [Anaerolineae bacterium]NUQ03313.1 twin-arginine translocation signal domain-containing protein [Anaerolineae bacterium]